MKKVYFATSLFLLCSNIFAQLTNKQGVSSIGIRPSASILSFGLPQPNTASQNSVLSYFPYPFTVFPINTSTNKQGKTEFSGLYGSFDLGLNITKLLQNDRLFRSELGIYYTCVPNSYSISDNYQFYLNTKQATFWQNTQSYTGLMGSLMYTTKSKGRRIWGEARNYLQLGFRTVNYINQTIENQEDWTFGGTGFKLQSELVNKKAFLFSLEVGRTYWRKSDDMKSLEMGIRVAVPTKSFTSNTITGFVNSQAIGGNNILENGAYISFQLAYSFPILQLQKFKIKPKTEKMFCQMERNVTVKHTYKITTDELILAIFDHENEDGDIVSVCFNGQYLLEKHLLTKSPKNITLKFLPNQRNILTIFADNTGKEGGNTTALKFTLNGKDEQIILYADKKESEGIEFYY